ncbi:hypothetical protein GALMADRAFT_127833 [Galerina marginata CBS 339.88]|uniref:BTB domain-containing protein n=1 Tax=Galerina marginata (strain CBS 339.88) TaxID=685588 RepID=A0A067STT7_GALM3|nr:hypothetical protein GALMADRAFT_127833 [Galerina marginata CBS 339.88]
MPQEPNPIEIRSEKFWFQSGDVVLHVENTQFKVHREMLSLHSNVFKDTFSMPQNADRRHLEDAFVDGCPVVPLSDKASDVEVMLSIFYYNFQKHNWRELMHIGDLSTLLRLGKKYEIDHFTKEALRRLRVDHPTTLDAWDAHDFYLAYQEIAWDDSSFDVDMCVINLAYEHSLLSILPVAYLRFLQLNSLDSIVLEEIEVCSTGRLQCILGNARISNFIRNRLTEWCAHEVLTPGKDCSTLQTCAALRLTTVDPKKFWLWAGFDAADHYSFLQPLEKIRFSGFCPACTKAIQTRYDEVRAQLWEKLPTFFGLPEWEELKKKDFDM